MLEFESKPVAVVYLARGADPDCLERFARFVHAYRSYEPGTPHRLYIIFKGFEGSVQREQGAAVFSGLDYQALEQDDLSYDIGAYAEALKTISETLVCFLNTNAEPASSYWLAKLRRQLDQPRVGMVGASGSFESLGYPGTLFPPFPNVHLRTNAFMMTLDLARDLLGRLTIVSKADAYAAESGYASVSRKVMERGLNLRLVGRNGRGYPPPFWPVSDTYRQGAQTNLLVRDNASKFFETAIGLGRLKQTYAAWGDMMGARPLLLLPNYPSDCGSALI